MKAFSTKLRAESTLTQRYQTTIPASIRKALNLSKNDKICYTIDSDNRVVISRVEETEKDPVLTNFLEFLARDMQHNPQNIQAISSNLVDIARSLVADVEIDLDAPL
jgi:antitoxin PrlF